MHASGSDLRSWRVQRVAVAYAFARVPLAALWLSILLDVSARSGSYARAGGAVAAYGVGVALVAPLVGRLADRHGARLVLSVCTVVQLPALLLLAVTADMSGPALLLPALLSGAVQPPLVPCMRAAWRVLVPDDEERRRCLAFDAVLGEVVDLGSPLLAVALNTTATRAGSLPVVAVAAAVAMAVFTLVVPPTPRQTEHEPVLRTFTRPAVSVLAVILVLTSALGAVEVGVVAVADAAGNRAAAGALLAVFAAASIVGGVLHARRRSSVPPVHDLVRLLGLLCLGLATTALVSDDLRITGALLALTGITVAPLVTVLLGLVERVARPGAVTLVFTLATTANFIGVAAGSAVAGVAVDLGAGSSLLDAGTLGLLVAAGLSGLALTTVVLVRGQLPADRVVADSTVAGLVAELEELWRQTREVGAENDALARELVRTGAGRS